MGSYPANGYGLVDVSGNVWEWTATLWTEILRPPISQPESLLWSRHPAHRGTRFVTKGGSHLCAPSYCHRYRPAARQGQTIRSTTGHLGFRGVVDR